MAVMYSQSLTYINNRHFIISTLQKAAERLCKIESPLIGRLRRPHGDFYRHAGAEWGVSGACQENSCAIKDISSRTAMPIMVMM